MHVTNASVHSAVETLVSEVPPWVGDDIAHTFLAALQVQPIACKVLRKADKNTVEIKVGNLESNKLLNIKFVFPCGDRSARFMFKRPEGLPQTDATAKQLRFESAPMAIDPPEPGNDTPTKKTFLISSKDDQREILSDMLHNLPDDSLNIHDAESMQHLISFFGGRETELFDMIQRCNAEKSTKILEQLVLTMWTARSASVQKASRM